PPRYSLFPYTTLFRSRNPPACLAELVQHAGSLGAAEVQTVGDPQGAPARARDVAGGLDDRRFAALVRIQRNVARIAVRRDGNSRDRKSTRLNSSHVAI